jgi:hypothetical protein
MEMAEQDQGKDSTSATRDLNSLTPAGTRPSDETLLAIRRTDARYQLAMRILNGLILVGALWVIGYWLAPAWGNATQVDVNFVMTVSVSLAITMTLVGVAATVKAIRADRERKRLASHCRDLESREQQALERARQLEGDLERFRAVSPP